VRGPGVGVGGVRSTTRARGNLEFQIGLPASLLKWVVPKGSIAVDGVSLTVAHVRSGGVLLSIIPHTVDVTTLGVRQAGDRVNIECDILVKRPTM
jgi:riboflavin synthase